MQEEMTLRLQRCSVLLLAVAAVAVQGELQAWAGKAGRGAARAPHGEGLVEGAASAQPPSSMRAPSRAGLDGRQRNLQAVVPPKKGAPQKRCTDLPPSSTAAFDQLMRETEGSRCSDFIKGVKDWKLTGAQLKAGPAVLPAGLAGGGAR